MGLSQYQRLWGDSRWLIAVQNIWIFGGLLIVFSLVFGYLLAVFMDQRIRQEDLFRSIFLYPFAMSLIVTGLIWQWMLDPNLGIENTIHSLGWTSFHFTPLVDPKTAIYGLVVAGIWQGSGVTMAILLAGLRGIDAEIWKAAKVDGIPTWRVYLFIALPMMRGALATAFVLQFVGVVRVYDLVVAMTGGGPGIATNMPAVYVIQMITSSQNVGQGMAAATMMLAAGACRDRPDRDRQLDLGPQAGGGRPQGARDRMTSTTAALPIGDEAAQGPKPRHLSPARWGVYAFLIIAALFFLFPLYVMIVTSLKTMPEIRQGHLFNLPQIWTVQPWIDAWLNACTGLDCNGLNPGFLNSVKITVPSVIISIVIASINGYALSFWRYKGSNFFFMLLVFGAFVPYQVVIYPLIMALRQIGLFATLPGIIIVHTIFGMPILTLLFRNYYASLPIELFKAARVDGAGFWRIFFRIMLPMSLPITVVAVILQVTGIWNDFLFGVVFAGRPNWPMTVQLNNIVNSTTGVREYNVNMAATILTAAVPLVVYFVSGRWFVRGIAAGAVKG